MRLLKKIAPLAASALMLGASIGFAAAADLGTWRSSFPGAETAIVIGSGAATSDNIGAVDIAVALSSTSSSTTETIVGEAHKIYESTDYLEFEEELASVTETLTEDDLPTILADGDWDNDEGSSTYNQYIDLPTASNVIHGVDADDDDDNALPYFWVDEASIVYTYRMEFSPAIESDDSSDDLPDYEDESITMLGKTWNIVDAITVSSDAGVKLTLMGGAETDTIDLDDTKTYSVMGSSYEVTLTFVDSDECAFTVNGVETDKLADGDTDKLADGTQIGVTEVYYQDYAGGKQRCKFYLGAQKVVLRDDDIDDAAYDADEIEVNDDDIEGLLVQIEGSYSSDVSKINYIKIKFTAQDDYYVGEDNLLSEAAEVEEYQLFGDTFDFEFQGLKEENTFDIEFKREDDDEVELVFENIAGDVITVPLYYNASGIVTLGEQSGKELVITEIENATSGYMIQDDDYFVVTSGDNTCVYQYKGENDGDEELKFKDMKAGGDTEDYSYTSECNTTCEDNLTAAIGTYGNNINLCGGKNFYVFVDEDATTNSDISIDLNDDSDLNAGVVDIKTQYEGTLELEGGGAAADSIIFTPDTTAIDDDISTEYLAINFSGDGDGFTDPAIVYSLEATRMDDTTLMTAEKDGDDDRVGYTIFGIKVFDADSDDDMDETTFTVPEKQLEALVYVKEVGAEITAGFGGGVGGAAVAVMDTEFSSVQSQNIIAIGGSAINSVSAEMLGLSFPTYGTDDTWINATGVDGIGKAILKIMDSPWTTGKFAMLVAGYEGTDTQRAAKVLREGTPAISGESVLLNTATSAVTIAS